MGTNYQTYIDMGTNFKKKTINIKKYECNQTRW